MKTRFRAYYVDWQAALEDNDGDADAAGDACINDCHTISLGTFDRFVDAVKACKSVIHKDCWGAPRIYREVLIDEDPWCGETWDDEAMWEVEADTPVFEAKPHDTYNPFGHE